MSLPPAFREVPRRVAWLRGLLLAACFGTMVASFPLWTNSRLFPVLPIAAWFPILPAPWDIAAFIMVLAALVAACRWYREAVTTFLIASALLVMGDQSRLQPWFYMYWVMLLLTLSPGPSAVTTCRLALSAVYVWSGIQKFNHDFYAQVAPWFVQPATSWLPEWMMSPLHAVVASAPIVELLIGLGLWTRWTRLPALVAAVAVHVMALVFLGPLGHRQNWIIWPWNAVMPLLAWTLFPPKAAREEGAGRRPQLWAAAVAGLFALLPLLSFFGRWDSYLSFCLYSGHLTMADLFVSAELREKLPPVVRGFTPRTPEPYNRQLQGEYVVRVDLWSTSVLKVPPLPEARNYRNIARWMAGMASDPNEVRLVVSPRVGPTLFYRGSDLRPEAGISLDR